MKVTDTEIYYINLKRVRQKYYNKEELTKFEKELLIMTTDNKEELRKISKGCREMESVAKKISKLSKEEEMQGIYLKEEQEAFIRDQIKAYAMKDGYNEGIEKGMEKSKTIFCKSEEEILKILKELVKSGDVLLFKASNGMKFYETANKFIKMQN